jgi:serine/threonine-protein kinase RIO1
MSTIDVPEAKLPLGYALLKPQEDAITKKDAVSTGNVILFPKLEKNFAMGAPSDRGTYQKYLSQLREKIHRAGVIHVDLYPDNILWCVREHEMILRIVDWDAATFHKDSFTETMITQLAHKDNAAYYFKSEGVAEPQCDY